MVIGTSLAILFKARYSGYAQQMRQYSLDDPTEQVHSKKGHCGQRFLLYCNPRLRIKQMEIKQNFTIH